MQIIAAVAAAVEESVASGLETQGLSCTSWQHADRVATGERRFDQLTLSRPKTMDSEASRRRCLNRGPRNPLDIAGYKEPGSRCDEVY